MPSVITPCGGAGGIKYNVANQTGGFLDVFTDTGKLDLEDRSGVGLYLVSENPDLTTGGFIGISTADGQVFVHSTIIRFRTSNRFEIESEAGTRRFLVDSAGGVEIRMAAGEAVDILDHNGNSVFTVFEDGTISAPALPTVLPGTAGMLWNDLGTVKIA